MKTLMRLAAPSWVGLALTVGLPAMKSHGQASEQPQVVPSQSLTDGEPAPAPVYDEGGAEPAPAAVPISRESKRAFEQEAQANVVIFYAGAASPDAPSTFYIIKPLPDGAASAPGQAPDFSRMAAMSEQDLTQSLVRMEGGRDLVVFILDRGAQRWPETLMESKVESLGAAAKEAGFQRFVVQFDRGANRAIYLDSAE